MAKDPENWWGRLYWLTTNDHANEWLSDNDDDLDGIRQEIHAHGAIEGSQTAVAPSFTNGFYVARIGDEQSENHASRAQRSRNADHEYGNHDQRSARCETEKRPACQCAARRNSIDRSEIATGWSNGTKMMNANSSSPLARLMALVKGVDSALTDTADPTLRATFGLAGLKAIAAEVQARIEEMQTSVIDPGCEHSARDAAGRRAKRGAVEGKPFLLDARFEDVLQLSTRARNCLASYGIRTVRDLLTFTEADLLRILNLGRGSLREISAELARYAYRLGDLDPSQRGDYCGAREVSATHAEPMPEDLPHEGS